MGLLGVATCLADRISDRFESDMIHHWLTVSLVPRWDRQEYTRRDNGASATVVGFNAWSWLCVGT